MEGALLGLEESHVREHYVQSALQVLAAGILFWDHLITFDKEIKYIWMRPKSRSSIIFFVFRYFTLATNISILVLSFRALEVKSCSVFTFYRQILLLISQCAVCTILMVRIYALYCADRRILWFFGATTMVVAGVSGYVLADQDQFNYPVQSVCHVGISRQTALRIAGLWMTLFVYDTIIFALTASRTYQFWREFNLGSLSLGVVNRPSLFSLFFRDGAMYFAVMALANLANILTFYLGGPFMRGGLSSFASCISATMLCRLMLNLHTTATTGLSTRPTLGTWRVDTIHLDEEGGVEDDR